MIRSSSVLRRSVPVLGALAAAAVLTACGGPVRTGTAAVVGSDRISVASVQARLAAFRTEAAAHSSGPYQEQSGLVGVTVSNMVLEQVVDHAVAEHGLTVTQAEIDQARQEQAQAWGGEAGLEQMLLLKHAVPAARIDDFYREQLGLWKLAALTGNQLGTNDGNEAVHQLLTQASAELKVSVNPRYGTWDPQQTVLDSPSADWLTQPNA
ncbi:hypothetical protein ACIGXM_07970 [Kitasatospora sp. NPDC052896]|uniref:hypothetical protein n=1 Tax=Kitasatospora sp. NPDC052896 TaxID=3364061 RepID=UPI0037CB6D2A